MRVDRLVATEAFAAPVPAVPRANMLAKWRRYPGRMATRPTRSRRPLLVGLTLGLLLAACGASGRIIDAPARGARAVAAPADPAEHIAVIMMENKEYGTVIGSSDAPYLNRLARRKVVLTQEYAVSHPSLPN